MRDVSSRALEMSLSGGSVRRVWREVRLAMVDECGVPVRLMTMGRMSTSVPGQWARMAFARGCIFGSNQVGWFGEVVASAVLPLPYLNFLNR
jgi:hypothetical protein